MILPEPIRFSPQEYRRFTLTYPHAEQILSGTFEHKGETRPFVEKSDGEVAVYAAMLSDEQQRALGLGALNELKRRRSASAPIWKYVATIGAVTLLAAAIFFARGKLPMPDGNDPTPTMIPAKTPTTAPMPTNTPKATATPTEQPTATPTVPPTKTPKVTPTPAKTPEPTVAPTEKPTAIPKPTVTPPPMRPPNVSIRNIALKGENGAVIPLLKEKCLVKPGERIIVTLKDVSEEEAVIELSASGQGRIEGNTYIAPDKSGVAVPLTIRILWKRTGEQLASKGIIIRTQRGK